MKTKALSTQSIKHWVVLSVAGAILTAAFFMPLQHAQAQSVSDLQEMIDDLLEQIAKMQDRIDELEDGESSDGDDDNEHTNGIGACVSEWARNLSIGDRGSDVRRLQQFLNADPDTRLDGVYGISGNETIYYGRVTADAVARFQEKYRSAVLAPVDESRGTGFFGAQTRAHIHELCGKKTEDDDISDDVDIEVSIDDMEVELEAVFTISDNYAVTGPVVLGSVDWGDGEDQRLTGLVVSRKAEISVEHVYDTPGTYKIVVEDTSGNTESVRVTAGEDEDEYDIDDIESVTTRTVDPIPQAADDEYTEYTIELEDGREIVIDGISGLATREMLEEHLEEELEETGYTGDVDDFLELTEVHTNGSSWNLSDVQSVTTRTVDPIAAAADDEYTEYTVTLDDGRTVVIKGISGIATHDMVITHLEDELSDTGYAGSATAFYEAYY